MKPLPFAALALALAVGRTGPPAAAAAPGAVIRYDVPKAGRASLAVYAADGRMVRTLLTGQPHAAGTHAAAWDGLDRYGRPLPAGEYTWKLVATEGLRAEFVTQVGQNPEPVWEKGVCHHHAPDAAAVDETGVYRFGTFDEGSHPGVKTDLDGRYLWTAQFDRVDPWCNYGASLAVAGGHVFMLAHNGTVYRFDTKTGQSRTAGTGDGLWNLRWEGGPAKVEGKAAEPLRDYVRKAGMDIVGSPAAGVLVTSYRQHDAVRWFGPKTGRQLGEAAVPAPVGVAVRPDGSALVISKGAVVAVTRDGKGPAVVVPADRLEAPWRVCVSPKTGDVFVAENSDRAGGGDAPRHHQVKRFSAEGKLLGTFGRPGGRGDGAYEPTDFRGLTDIEADHAGGFVATEGDQTPPRRSARFDADGKLVREWFGAQHYGVLACPEPADPRFVWTLANAPRAGLIRWEVDYAKGTWRPAEVYQDVFAANRFAAAPGVPTVFEHGGRTYIHGGSVYGGLAVVIYDPKAKRVRPCVTSGKRDGRGAYLWTDRNDDGLATDDEVTWLKRTRLGGWVDPADLSLRTTPIATDYSPGHRLVPVRVTPGGTPVYDPDRAEKLAPWEEAGKAFHPGDFRRAADGGLVGCFSEPLSNPHESHENHGAWYYNSCSGIDRLVKWDRAGRPVWSVGRHSPDADHETGSTAMARGLVGLTHGCVVWADASDAETARPTVWTEDGLYVDELLRVPLGTLPKAVYGQNNANEYPSGHLHTDPKTGDVLYYALTSAGGSPVYRVTGWDGWHRQAGTITLTTPAPAVARRDGIGLKAEYFNTPDCTGEPALTRTDKVVYFNWGKGSPDKAVTAAAFSVRWSGQYEAATNEDVRFEVRGNFPWRDRGRPTVTKLWLNGQLVLDSKEETNTVRVRLAAGQRVDLRLECGFKKGEAALAFGHDTPTLDRRAVLPDLLHPTTAGETAAVTVVTETRPAVLARFDFEETDGPLAWSAAGGDVFGRLTGDAKRVPGKAGRGSS